MTFETRIIKVSFIIQGHLYIIMTSYFIICLRDIWYPLLSLILTVHTFSTVLRFCPDTGKYGSEKTCTWHILSREYLSL